MTTPLPVRSVPARAPGDADADAASLTLVLSHADVAALRRQLALLIAPEPYGEGDDTQDSADDLRPGLRAGTSKVLPGGAARKP